MPRGRAGTRDQVLGTATRITCHTCGGCGEEDLPPAYRATYALLEIGAWKTTSAILAALGGGKSTKGGGHGVPRVGQTALANRLVYLERLGLAASRQSEANFRMKEWRRL